MTKKEIIEQLRNNVYCRLKPSKVSGVGVFAIRKIPKGTDPFRGCDTSRYLKLPEGELTGIDPEVMKYFKDVFVYEDGCFWVPSKGLQAIDISYFLNHSKKPNMVATHAGEQFTAKRDIRKGEELLVDYDSYDESNEAYR